MPAFSLWPWYVFWIATERTLFLRMPLALKAFLYLWIFAGIARHENTSIKNEARKCYASLFNTVVTRETELQFTAYDAAKPLVDWKRFSGLVEEHDRTVEGFPLPGPFDQDRLYLMGARLTAPYDKDNGSVHVTLFGMPGDFWKREKDGKRRCQGNNLSGNNGTLLPYTTICETLAIFVQVECNEETTNHIGGDPSSLEPVFRRCGLIELELIPLQTGDINNNNVTLIWTAPLDQIFQERDMSQMTKVDQKTRKASNETIALRLSFSVASREGSKAPLTKEYGSRETTHLATVDIPLSTGVVGHGGPQILSPLPNSSVRKRKPPMNNFNTTSEVSFQGSFFSFLKYPHVRVSLCLAIYSHSATKYLPEFVEHHLNVGFEHIVIGILRTHLGSDIICHVQSVLSFYLAEGTVAIAGMGFGTKPDLSCEINIEKSHFYNTCLYHSKGLAEYMGTWDLDEYWMPPLSMDECLDLSTCNESKSERKQPLIALREEVTHVPPEQSMYSKTPNIFGVMKSIQAYHHLHGCGESWCFHAFPSRAVFRRVHGIKSLFGYNSGTIDTRSNTIYGDFEHRIDGANWEWSKSVARTKNAYASGTHQAGSCCFSNYCGSSQGNVTNYHHVIRGDYPYENDKVLKQCRNLRMEGFGSLHHFFTLSRTRSWDEVEYQSFYPVDEYAAGLSITVQAHLIEVYKKKET